MGSFVLILALVWVLSIGIWWVLTRYVRNVDMGKIRNRLSATTAKKKKDGEAKPVELIQKDEASAGKILLRILRKFELHGRLATLLEQSGLKWSANKLIQTSLLMFLLGYVGGWMFLPEEWRLAALIPAIVGALLPILFIIRKRKARLHKFEEQFPESLEFVARSMRAGHAFSVSLEMLHREFQEPLSGEFRRTFEEHNLGMPLEVALEKLGQRVPLLDVHFFVSAVMLQKRTGGNLAEILDKLAFVIRERFKLRGRIRAISAHGRMTGMALTSIPIGVAVLMFWVNPDYIRFFFNDEIGNMMMAAAVGLQILGYAIIQKIVNIEV